MASKKIIYGIGALGTAAVTSTAIAVPLSLRKSGKKSPYQSLLVGTKLNTNQLTELKKQAVVTNATAGDIKQAYIDNDKLAVEYDKSGVKTIVVFKLSDNKLLTIASSLSGKKYVVSYETGTAKVLQLPKGSKEKDVKDNAETFKTVIDDAISANSTALADIKDNEDIIPSGKGKSTTSGVTTGAPTATATFKWPAGQQTTGLWKVGDEYYTTKAKALTAAGYTEVNSGLFNTNNKYASTIANLPSLTDSPTTPTSGSITVDGVTYIYYANQSGGPLDTPAWFDSTATVTAAGNTPSPTIPAKVYKDKQSGAYYDDEDGAIAGAGYEQKSKKLRNTNPITVDGTQYTKKEGADAPGYAAGTAGWKSGSTYGAPDVSSADSGWSVTIDGTTYYKIKTDQVHAVAAGWYPASATVSGSVAPGTQASDEDVLAAAQGSAPSGFQYVATAVPAVAQVHAVAAGWYPASATVSGTSAPGTQASDADVLAAAQGSAPSGFQYVATAVEPVGGDIDEQVAAGWYPASATVDGSVAPGTQASDEDVLAAAQGSAPSGFQYVATAVPAVAQVHAVAAGWYPASATVSGTSAPGTQASDADVLAAAQGSAPSGFQYVATDLEPDGGDIVEQVAAGWYPASATVDGSVAPGTQASDEDVLAAAQGSAPSGFQYVATAVPAVAQVHAVAAGWYPASATVSGTSAPGTQASDADVLAAAQGSAPSGFQYVGAAVSAHPAQDKWNIQQDGGGDDKTNAEINNLISTLTTNGKKVTVNDGSNDTEYTYHTPGNPGAQNYNAGTPGWYDSSNTKLDLSTLARDFYTPSSGPESQFVFKRKSEIVEEYLVPTDGSLLSITIKTDISDVIWNWKTTFDGSALSNGNKGFYQSQPSDDNGTGKLNTSTITYKWWNNSYYTAIDKVEEAARGYGWEDANSGFINSSNNYFANLAATGIQENQSLSSPTSAITVKIDGQDVTAEEETPSSTGTTSTTASPSIIYASDKQYILKKY